MRTYLPRCSSFQRSAAGRKPLNPAAPLGAGPCETCPDGPPPDPIGGSKELYGVQTCRRPQMGPSYVPVICDSSSKTRGLRVASGHRLVPFEPFFIGCMHKRARLRGSPGHIRARIRSSNCTFTTTSTSIYECCNDVCTHPIGSYDHICNLDHMYMPRYHV